MAIFSSTSLLALQQKTTRMAIISEQMVVSLVGLGVIIGYLEETREQGGDIRICGVNDPVIQDIFETTGFPKIIQFHKDLGTARLSF